LQENIFWQDPSSNLKYEIATLILNHTYVCTLRTCMHNNLVPLKV
jgi:hypothetical protein